MAIFDVRQYAEIGARIRLTELMPEADRIRRAFPGIGTQLASTATQSDDGARRGRRSAMTVAARKAVSSRMKAYWAARRAGTPSTSSDGKSEAIVAPSKKSTPARQRASRKKR
jgi:hypothetical protein